MDGHWLFWALIRRFLSLCDGHCLASGVPQESRSVVAFLVDECLCLVRGALGADTLADFMLHKLARFTRDDLLRACFLDVALRCPELCEVLISLLGCFVKVSLAVELGLRQLEVHVPQAIVALRIHCVAVSPYCVLALW